VFDGEVALVSDKKNDFPSRTLRRRAANEIAADGSIREIKYDQLRFLRRVPATAYELAVLRSRPLAYWRLDDLKANVLMTSEGQVAASTMPSANIALADSGRPGRPGAGPLHAALFTGEHDGIDIAGGPELGLVSNCSCEAWVLPTAAVTGPQRIFSTFDRPRAGWAIGVVDGRWYKLPEDDLKFHLTIYGVYDCVSTTPIAANEWVHLAATIDNAGTPALYVNGARMERRFRPPNTIGGENGAETPAAVWSADSPTPIGKTTAGAARIGRNPVGSDSAISPERWQGQISNVAVYDRVLTEQEIHDHFEATRKRKTEGRARGT
jgi:hypothetical protein